MKMEDLTDVEMMLLMSEVLNEGLNRGLITEIPDMTNKGMELTRKFLESQGMIEKEGGLLC